MREEDILGEMILWPVDPILSSFRKLFLDLEKDINFLEGVITGCAKTGSAFKWLLSSAGLAAKQL